MCVPGGFVEFETKSNTLENTPPAHDVQKTVNDKFERAPASFAPKMDRIRYSMVPKPLAPKAPGASAALNEYPAGRPLIEIAGLGPKLELKPIDTFWPVSIIRFPLIKLIETVIDPFPFSTRLSVP